MQRICSEYSANILIKSKNRCCEYVANNNCEYPANKQFLFVFVALRPMSTAMVIAGQSVHLTTLFPGQA